MTAGLTGNKRELPTALSAAHPQKLPPPKPNIDFVGGQRGLRQRVRFSVERFACDTNICSATRVRATPTDVKLVPPCLGKGGAEV